MQTTTKTVVILGSARGDGNTRKIVDFLLERSDWDLINLNDKRVEQFTYAMNHDDDFISIIKDVTENYDRVILATPVYWYTMSGVMKAFFDRFTDLLYAHKDLGKALEGKEMAVVSCGGAPVTMPGFHMPFQETAKYMKMNYLGDVHTSVQEEEIPANFKEALEAFLVMLKPVVAA